MTERELRSMISQSREDGYRALFQQYQNYVYAIIWNKIKTVGTKEDAEDCVSEVFTDVFLHYDDIHEGSLQSYIGTVAKHTAIDMFRKRTSVKMQKQVEEEELQFVAADTDVASEFENKTVSGILYEKIRSLGEPDATIVLQKYFYDRKADEIAKTLEMQTVAVRVRLSRALKKLRKLLAEDGVSL
ncbi:MAG TPA: RNA polymerase subunit sigma-24 [Ruminococcus sp.]|nr:RNA polymerase subunit sigma-24 [Ruminococcus sp.]